MQGKPSDWKKVVFTRLILRSQNKVEGITQKFIDAFGGKKDESMEVEEVEINVTWPEIQADQKVKYLS